MRRLVINPGTTCGRLAEVKALAAQLDYSVELSSNVPPGQAFFFDMTDVRIFDESRPGRGLQSF